MRMSDWSSDVCSSDLPRELYACIASIRQLYPGKKLTMVFQPHLFSRTRDFADEFAESLAKVDELILLEIYPAREKPLEGVNSSMLLDKIRLEKKQLSSQEDLFPRIGRKGKIGRASVGERGCP